MNIINTITTPLQRKIIAIHIICWLIFIFYELRMIYAITGNIGKPYVYLVFYPINIAYFYSCVALLNYTFRQSKPKIIKGIISFLIVFLIYLLVKGLADYVTSDQSPAFQNKFVSFQGFFKRNFARGMYFSLLAIFYWSAGHISYFKRQASEAERSQLITQRENAELETVLTKTKNAYLQQQLNPHMLFNTLSFIYTNVQRHSEDAARVVWLLSEIMRYSLEPTGADGKVNLEKEVEQMEHLLEINRYRFQSPLFIDFDLIGNFQHFRIIPLILMTITENVFKHGNLTEPGQPATVTLKTDEKGKLYFSTSNLKKAKPEHVRSQQIGLQNIRLRLDAEYPNNYSLMIKEPGERFDLMLTLNL